jgi:hypothetical protein
MSQALYLQYQTDNIYELAQKLNLDYQEPIEALAHLVKTTLSEDYPADYLDSAYDLLNKLKDFIAFSRSTVIYTQELHRKNISGHDCRTCSGACNIDHSIKLTELQKYAIVIKRLMLEVHELSAGIPLEIKSRPSYVKHKYGVLLLDKTLCELFFLEEVFLVPALRRAQRSIYARS